MPQSAIAKLLSYAFSVSELKLLMENEEFLARRAQVETLPDFEACCTYGFRFLHRTKQLCSTRKQDLGNPRPSI